MVSDFNFEYLLYHGWLKKYNEFASFKSIPLPQQIEQPL